MVNRRGLDRDLEGIHTLWKTVIVPLERTGLDHAVRERTPELLKQLLQSERTVIGIASPDSYDVTGSCLVTGLRNGEEYYNSLGIDNYRTGCIGGLMVHPDYRGSGIGEAVARFAEDRTRERGIITDLYAETDERNHVIRHIFGKIGYEEVDSMPYTIPESGRQTNVIILHKRLL